MHVGQAVEGIVRVGGDVIRVRNPGEGADRIVGVGGDFLIFAELDAVLLVDLYGL